MTRQSVTNLHAPPLSLDPVGGPPITLNPCLPDKSHTVGRSSTCEVQLPDKAVSRSHALLRAHAGSWSIMDLGSKHGTYINGVRMEPNDSAPLRSGDLLSIDPWTFRVRMGGERPRGVATTNDFTLVTQQVRVVQAADLASLAQQRLALLIECSASIQTAGDEAALAEVVLDAALKGTGFSRAALLRTNGGVDAVNVVLARPASASGGFSFSRSLLRGAEGGEVVSLSDTGGGDGGFGGDIAVSIVSLAIQAAVCAPVHLGPAIDSYLYLDTRQGEKLVHAESIAFIKMLARMYGAALGSLKRLDGERLRGQLRAELEAAGAAQAMILPQPQAQIGPVRYAFKSRPGRFASGDLFDVVAMPDGRVGVFLGDVSGKGVGAALMMAVAQTHLNAHLAQGLTAAEAVASLNRYVATRVGSGRFITLWLGVFDPAARTLDFGRNRRW